MSSEPASQMALLSPIPTHQSALNAPSIARSESPTLYSANILPSSQNIAGDAARQPPATAPADLPPNPTNGMNPPAPPPAPSIQDDNYSYTNDPTRAQDPQAVPEPEEAEPALPTNEPVADSAPVVEQTTPKHTLTVLLVSGRRRTIEFEPSSTVRELKEQIWSTWPTEWSDELPPYSSFLRILYLGRILTDETTLSSLNLAAPPESTVVHVSVRPFAPTSSDEDMKKNPKRRRTRRGRNSTGDGAPGTGNAADPNGQDTEEDSGGCCGCVIC